MTTITIERKKQTRQTIKDLEPKTVFTFQNRSLYYMKVSEYDNIISLPECVLQQVGHLLDDEVFEVNADITIDIL